MKNTRPVFLNLFKIRFPIMAIVSILHRVSGFVLFFAIPLFLWAMSASLQSEDGFGVVKQLLIGNLIFKILVFLLLSALIYHLFAGIRHLLMDWGRFESLIAARVTSICVIAVSILFVILLGSVLW